MARSVVIDAVKGMFLSASAAVVIVSFLVSFSSAHEFWVEPKDSNVESGGSIQATLNVGQDLKGNTYSYLPPRFERFTVTVAGDTYDVPGRAGDNPALNMAAEKNGLHIFAYQSKPEKLIYSERKKFQAFLDYEGLDQVLSMHDARGLPDKGFRENYTRFAKTLVQVGNLSGGDEDQPVGLPIEIIADGNPVRNESDQLDVQLLYEGRPLADVQIAVFHRYLDGNFDRTLARTNSMGRARLALNGSGFYLLSAVHMLAVNENADGEDKLRLPAWHSLWASLSFHRE